MNHTNEIYYIPTPTIHPTGSSLELHVPLWAKVLFVVLIGGAALWCLYLLIRRILQDLGGIGNGSSNNVAARNRRGRRIVESFPLFTFPSSPGRSAPLHHLPRRLHRRGSSSSTSLRPPPSPQMRAPELPHLGEVPNVQDTPCGRAPISPLELEA